jgi:rubrerythrin
MKIFNGKELLSLLAESEENVANLYFGMAEKMKDDKAKKVFEKLGKDELVHKKMYLALMDGIEGDLPVELGEDDYEYIKSLIDYNMFNNKAVKKRYVKEDALVLAEKIERDTLLLATEMLEMFPDVATEQLKAVMKEEKKHLKFVLQSQQNQMYKTLGL